MPALTRVFLRAIARRCSLASAAFGGVALMSAAIASAACHNATDPAERGMAGVVYVLDAPLCSSRLPVEFRIDSALVGVDTFTVHLAPNHGTSQRFPINAGRHVVGARVSGGLVWSDTSVTLLGGQTFTDSLPFYCS